LNPLVFSVQPWASEAVKEYGPPMNTDEHR
jgi:hypothetical protein